MVALHELITKREGSRKRQKIVSEEESLLNHARSRGVGYEYRPDVSKESASCEHN